MKSVIRSVENIAVVEFSHALESVDELADQIVYSEQRTKAVSVELPRLPDLSLLQWLLITQPTRLVGNILLVEVRGAGQPLVRELVGVARSGGCRLVRVMRGQVEEKGIL